MIFLWCYMIYMMCHNHIFSKFPGKIPNPKFQTLQTVSDPDTLYGDFIFPLLPGSKLLFTQQLDDGRIIFAFYTKNVTTLDIFSSSFSFIQKKSKLRLNPPISISTVDVPLCCFFRRPKKCRSMGRFVNTWGDWVIFTDLRLKKYQYTRAWGEFVSTRSINRREHRLYIWERVKIGF